MGGILETIGLKRKRERPPIIEQPAKPDREGALAAERERLRRRREGGRASTIVSSPLGVLGPANTATKRLTGE